MVREGTRSQTGNSRPRIFQAVDTAPTATRKRTTAPKVAKKSDATPAKGSKPEGVAKAKVTKPKATKKSEPKKAGPLAKVKEAASGVVEKAGLKKPQQKKKKTATATAPAPAPAAPVEENKAADT